MDGYRRPAHDVQGVPGFLQIEMIGGIGDADNLGQRVHACIGTSRGDRHCGTLE
jgi:hypothetical protein